MRWTNRSIDALRPKPSREKTRYSCPTGSGLSVIVNAGGSRRYSFRYRWCGKLVEIPIGSTSRVKLSRANAQVALWIEMLEDGIDPRARLKVRSPIAAEETVSKAVQRWLDSVVARRVRTKHTQQSYRSLMKCHVLPVLGNRQVASITAADLEVLIADMLAADKDLRTVKLVPRLKDFFKWAKRTYQLPGSPAIELATPVRERKRTRVIDDAELKPWYDGLVATDPLYRLPLEFLLRTGARKMEVLRMAPADIKWDEGIWLIPGGKTKNGHAHGLPLLPCHGEIIEQAIELAKIIQDTEDPPYVFSGVQAAALGQSSLNYHVKNGCKYFGLEHWVIHDLRRTATSQMAAARVPYEHRERVLNHLPPEMDQHYNCYDYLDEKYEALEKLNARLDKLFAGQEIARTVVPFKVRAAGQSR